LLVTSAPAEVIDNRNFGFCAAAVVRGKVFGDANGNGLLDPGEDTYINVPVYADLNDNQTLDPGEPQSNSSSATYTLGSLPPGTYKIRVVIPLQYVQTAPANGAPHLVTLALAQTLTNRDFGIRFDNVAPSVTASSFEVDGTTQQLRVTFSEAVGASLTASDLQLVNLTTGATIDSANFALSYDNVTNVATFTFPGLPRGILPDGDYRASIAAASVFDAAHNLLAQDLNYDFYFLQGDVNRDRMVDLADFNILSANFGQGARVFSQGDFNYDGLVNLADFNILASRFGRSLGAPSSSRSMLAEPLRLAPFSDARIGSLDMRLPEKAITELLL
jgi:hypothetical protein